MSIPHVGIFWFIPDHNGRAFLLYDGTPLPEAEPYGDCATHARGHYEYWSELALLGEGALGRRGLPSALAQHEYEDFPRGRIVYRVPEDRFTIFADRKLFARHFIDLTIAAFSLPADRCDVRSDAHYRSRRPAPPVAQEP